MKKPNLLLVYCDDLGYGDLGCYGSEHIRTPHLDHLATGGIRFTDWYSNSPVCSPSRAALLTGRYPARAGVGNILGGKRGHVNGLPAEELTLAEWLRRSGYRTGLFGKWHLGTSPETRPNAHGFETFYGFMAGCVDYYSHIFYWDRSINPVHDLWDNNEEVWENGRYLTELITDKTVEFLDRQQGEPFFAMVGYNAPHYPMHAPQEYMDRYKHLPWDRQVMAAMISAVDDGVGRIVRKLEEIGELENTIIFFSSDNGPSTEARNWLDGTEDIYYGGSAGVFRGHKASLFEGGIREPAILYGSSLLPQGKVCAEPVMMADLFPTFLALAGLEPPADRRIDGLDLTQMLRNDQPTPHETICWEYGNQLAIRRGNWKLVLNGKLDFSRKAADPVHLSDLSADPGERVNLADAYPELVAELTAIVQVWREQVTGR